MLALKMVDPAIAELDRKIAAKLKEWRAMMAKAEYDPNYLQHAESAYADMDSLLELRSRSAKKRTETTSN